MTESNANELVSRASIKIVDISEGPFAPSYLPFSFREKCGDCL